MPQLPAPPTDRPALLAWVDEHLGHLTLEGRGSVVQASPVRGGQDAADTALARLDLRGYAARRNEVAPVHRRGASGLSPYIRHGLLTLPRVWAAAADAPPRDRDKFRDELLWQEYARHVYARLGRATGEPLRFAPPAAGSGADGATSARDPWPSSMACMDLTVTELHDTGWLVNQTRMWLASQWAVRAGADWREGEDEFFRHLLDGSRAANRLGWQWTVGTATGKPYGFSRWQVTKRAPGLCDTCALASACPIEQWPDAEPGPARPGPSALESSGVTDPGPGAPQLSGTPQLVWLTAESLGDDDPAARAHPDLETVFVFDEPLLARLRLSAKRLVFLAETLAERGTRVHLGDPTRELAGVPLATTWAPVPGWAPRARALDVAALYPWPWLRRPGRGSLRSFSAWVHR